MGRGDCDGSKELDSSDVFELLQHTANVGAGNEGTLTGKELLAADIDGNGSVDSTDLFELLRYCAEKGAGLQPPGRNFWLIAGLRMLIQTLKYCCK